MTQKLPSDEFETELSWEEAVSRYLEEHPDYFQRYPEIVAQLLLSHETGGKAVSLIERQVSLLREQSGTLQRQLRELLNNARDNDVLSGRLHRFAAAMIGCTSLDDVIDTTYDILRQEFKLDAVVILLHGRVGTGERPELVPEDDKRLNMLFRQFNSGKPICGGQFDESLMSYLFSGRASEIKSSALIPLGEKNPHGILGLGTHDPHRFHPGMGTVYLTRLGELLTHSLARHHG
ncbi:MAG: DUF484 family protein [Sulfuricaulis sp.]